MSPNKAKPDNSKPGKGRGRKTAPPPQAPRTTEQLVGRAASAHGMGYARRSARGHGYEQRGLAYVPASRLLEGKFGRMFRLPPFVPTDERITEIAEAMTEGDAGRDPLLDNPDIPAGYTYLGQFVDHDITFDTASSLERQNDPDALTNFRTPRFDLDCVYGRGPADDPFLYDADADRVKLLIDHHDNEDDLQRNSQGTALIGDPRNDENTFVSQWQLTMLKFHNAIVDRVEADPSLKRGSETTFEAAQRIARWHYQWLVIHDLLRRIVGDAMLAKVLDESGPLPKVDRRFYKWEHNPYMPVEFSVAAYRFGHSMIRGGYKLNTLVPPLPTFTPDPVNTNPLGHFGGFRILPPGWTIEWARFFELGGAASADLQPSRLIDTKLANVLTRLPPEIGGSRPSLIERNLLRGARLLLPSGQDVARHMGFAVLTDAELDLPSPGPAPLWYYVLKEASVQAAGRHLGETGGRIVAEVFLGLLEKDPSSYLRNEPGWKPFLPSTIAGDFTAGDLVAVAGHGLGVTDSP
ncbi:peroxidase family protein [Agromyces arachidis]|uniref:peroxidase family protein n=1 Tax=Agromyces arachidis TaxID=766966 RepID=UPI004056042D